MIGQNLRTLRKERNLTLEQLANNLNERYQDKERSVNFNKGKLSKWENNKDQPYLSSARLLADYFDITVDMLMGREPIDVSNDITAIYNQLEEPRQTRVYNFARRQLDEQKTVSVYGQTAAGRALEYDQSSVEEETVEYIPKGTDGALNVRGDSMEPLLHDGDLLFFQKVDMVENGEIAVVEINGEAVTTKKVKFDYANQKIILQSLNDKYDDMVFNDDEVRIIGKVLNK